MELNTWRPPRADEAVRSMVYHGINAGDVWPRWKKLKAGYLNFRAVKETAPQH